MEVHEPAGRHLLATLQGCDAAILDDEARLYAAVERAGTPPQLVHVEEFGN